MVKARRYWAPPRQSFTASSTQGEVGPGLVGPSLGPGNDQRIDSNAPIARCQHLDRIEVDFGYRCLLGISEIAQRIDQLDQRAMVGGVTASAGEELCERGFRNHRLGLAVA